MRYIIMCGGQYPKWETPRQLTHICGEPVVARTIRMLREAGVEDIAISASDSRFEAFDVPVLKHPNGFVAIKDGGGSWVDAFWPTEDPACYLMGDVVFSPYAIRRIVETQTDLIQFFASSYPFSGSYIKQHAEPFAFKIVDQKRFREAIDFVRRNERTGIFIRRPIAWELWQVINHEDVRMINFGNYIAINDYTCDIDTPEDAPKIESAIRREESDG